MSNNTLIEKMAANILDGIDKKAGAENQNVDDNMQKAKQMGKNVLHDRVLSKLKNAAGTEAFTLGGLAAGTALGMKKGLGGKALNSLGDAEKRQLFRKSMMGHGLTGMAIGSAGSNIAVPAARLTAMHRKEFGTNPDLKDYAKVESTHGLPTSLYWGAVLKNRKGLEKGLEHAADSAMKFKQTKKLNDLKGAIHGAAGTGALAAADQAADALEFFNTPEAIIRKKKEQMAQNGGKNMPKVAYVVDEAKDISMDAFDVVMQAFDKHAEIQDEYMEKEAATLKQVLKGDNVKAVDKIIAGTRKAKGTADMVGNVADFAENVAKPHMKNIDEIAKGNQYLKREANGSYSILDHKRDLKHLADSDMDFNKKFSAANQAKFDHNKNVKAIEDHINQYKHQTEGKGSKLDDMMNAGKYRRNAKLNEHLDSIAEKLKNGEDLSLEEKMHATRLHGSEFGVDLRSGDLKAKANKVKSSAGNLKKYEDEASVRKNMKAIENHNRYSNIKNSIGGAANETKRILDETDDHFTVNGAVPTEGLQHLRNQEATKTMAARTAIGAGAVGAGVLAHKALAKKTQATNNSQLVNPYNAREERPRNDFNRENNFRPRNDSGRENNFRPRNNFNDVNKVAEEIVFSALMEK